MSTTRNVSQTPTSFPSHNPHYVDKKTYDKLWKMVTGPTTPEREKQLKEAKHRIYRRKDIIITNK